MSDLVEKIRALEGLTTEGPWRSEEGNGPTNEYAKATIGVGSEPVFNKAFEELENACDAEDEHWVAGIWGKCDAEHEANAALIALAPEMARKVLAAEELAEAVKRIAQEFTKGDCTRGGLEYALAAYRDT